MFRFLRLAFWLAALLAFVMATVPHPIEIAGSDKVQHIAAFSCITVLGCMAYPRLPRLKLALALIAFGGLIEMVQLVPMLHRDSEWGDFLVDIIAVIGALAGMSLFGRKIDSDSLG